MGATVTGMPLLARFERQERVRDVEVEVARHIVRQGLLAAPVVLALAGLVRGVDGIASAGYAFALVLGNLLVAAASLAWAARRGPNALMAVALFGFLVRLSVMTIALFAVKDGGWVDMPVLGLVLIAAHLGLLFWETRFVGLTLAAPGLRPSRQAFLATFDQE